MEILRIENYLDNWTFGPDDLVERFGYWKSGDEGSTLVYTDRNNVVFGDREFSAEFFFYERDLSDITLTPIIPGLKGPQFPNKEHEITKVNYCIALLKNMYGDELTFTPEGVRYETEKYTLLCEAVTKGRDMFTGGDIAIIME